MIHFIFDVTNYDYHLLPNSPCIDVGNPNYLAEPNETDLDGNPRVLCRRIDMGAYEADYIEAAMKFTPQVLNCSSSGQWVKAYIILPEGLGVGDVDTNVPAKIWPFGIECDYAANVYLNEDDIVEIEIVFERATFCGAIDYGPAEITVVGSLTSGQYFYGTDNIRIITNNRKYLAVFASYWLQTRPDLDADLDNSGHVDFKDFSILANSWRDVCPE